MNIFGLFCVTNESDVETDFAVIQSVSNIMPSLVRETDENGVF